MTELWSEKPLSLSGARIFVAGHGGLVGSALCARLKQEQCTIITAPRSVMDLRDSVATQDFLNRNKPDMAIVAAARVGGILANNRYPADFLYDNMMIAANVIHGAFAAGVRKLLFLGSACIYPRDAAEPLSETAFLSGPFEPTNEAYALAKITGMKLCEFYRTQHGCDFMTAIPCNLYGPNDRFDAEYSHVIPALLMKVFEARQAHRKNFPVWGSGSASREFLYSDDLADALVFMLRHYKGMAPLNIGSGETVSIRELSGKISKAAGFKGHAVFDMKENLEGARSRLLDSSAIHGAGWMPKTLLDDGLRMTCAWYENRVRIAGAA